MYLLLRSAKLPLSVLRKFGRFTIFTTFYKINARLNLENGRSEIDHFFANFCSCNFVDGKINLMQILQAFVQIYILHKIPVLQAFYRFYRPFPILHTFSRFYRHFPRITDVSWFYRLYPSFTDFFLFMRFLLHGEAKVYLSLSGQDLN